MAFRLGTIDLSSYAEIKKLNVFVFNSTINLKFIKTKSLSNL